MYELAFIRIQFAIHYKSTIFGTDQFDSFGVINILLQKWLVLLQRKSKIRIFIFPIRSSYKIIQSLILNHWNAESSRKTRSIYYDYDCMPEYGFFLNLFPIFISWRRLLSFIECSNQIKISNSKFHTPQKFPKSQDSHE